MDRHESSMELIMPHGGLLKELYLAPEEAATEQAAARDYLSWDLTPRQLADLELILNGSFSPLTGFMGSEEVDSVGAHGKGDIDVVVDKQPGTVLTGQAPQLTCQRQKLVDREIFLPELDGLDAALQRSFDDGRKSLPGRKLVTIGDQVEIEVDGKGHA